MESMSLQSGTLHTTKCTCHSFTPPRIPRFLAMGHAIWCQGCQESLVAWSVTSPIAGEPRVHVLEAR